MRPHIAQVASFWTFPGDGDKSATREEVSPKDSRPWAVGELIFPPSELLPCGLPLSPGLLYVSF